MRILAVTHYQPPHYGGIETVAAALVERYRRAGHEVLWLSSDLPPTPPAAGCRRVPAWNFLEERLGVPYPIWHGRASETVRQWVQWCDAVHLHDCLYMGSVLALWHARRLGKPTLVTQHVGPVPYRSAVLRGTQQLAYAILGRWAHQQADQVVFVSRAVLDWFRQRVGYRRVPRFVPNGVDPSIFHFGDEGVRRAARERLGLGAESPLVAFVGRFVDKKGVLIVEQVARLHPQSLFVMIGEGPIRPSAWGLPNVVVRPFQLQTALRDYYWAADVLLLPSTGEGFPLVVMEAMACGTPAIISSETFAAWNDGREYFLVGEPTVSAVMGLLAEPRLRTEVFRQSVSAYASAHWNWDEIAAEYLRMLRGLACRG
jgi:glycosyltransferase involved in cell wall biosynthesis